MSIADFSCATAVLDTHNSPYCQEILPLWTGIISVCSRQEDRNARKRLRTKQRWSGFFGQRQGFMSGKALLVHGYGVACFCGWVSSCASIPGDCIPYFLYRAGDSDGDDAPGKIVPNNKIND
jgi:hypothetical protein